MPNSAVSSQRRPARKRQPNLTLIGLRINEGLSREALALRIGVGKETIRLAEAGWVPSPRVQFALANAFGLRPLDLWPIETQPSIRFRKVAMA